MPEKKQEIYPRCTLCRCSLSSLSIAEQIPPFWNKLALFFTYPLCRSALIVIFLYSLVASLLPEGNIGTVIYLLMLFPLIEFLFELMEQVANGEKIGSEIKPFFTSKNKSMFIKMLLTYGFMVILISKAMVIVGASFGYLMAAFFILGVPASLLNYLIKV